MAITTFPLSEATIDFPDTPPPGISIPLWNVDAPGAGAFLGPKGEDILCTLGTGHMKLPVLGCSVSSPVSGLTVVVSVISVVVSVVLLSAFTISWNNPYNSIDFEFFSSPIWFPASSTITTLFTTFSILDL